MEISAGGTSGAQDAPGPHPTHTHTPLPSSVSGRKPIARPVLNSTAKWPGFTGRGARARSDPLPGSQEALQKRGEFLRGVPEGPLRPGLSVRQCPLHWQTRDLRRGGGAAWRLGGASPLHGRIRRHLLIFARTSRGAAHPGAGPGRAEVFPFNDSCPVVQVQRGGDAPTLSSAPRGHRWPRPHRGSC